MPSPTDAADAAFPTPRPELETERFCLRAMLESSADYIYFKDTESRFLRINRALANYFGLNDPAEAVGKTDFDFFPEDKAREQFQDERCIMDTGRPVTDKIERQVRAEGRVVWLLTSKARLCDGEGRLVGTFGISRDITLLKEMEDALWNERNLLRNVIDHVPDFIFAKDTEGRYTLSNLALARFFQKKSPEEILGKTLADLFPADIAQSSRADDLRVLNERRPMVNKVGSLASNYWFATTKIPLFNNAGEVAGLVAISRDITEEKLAHEALKKANADLLRSRGELVKTLEELRSVQLQLVEAEKMKLVGRLAAGVAHEVKNPLAIISMGLEYLNGRTFEDPNVAVILTEIGSAVERADSVIRELLDFSAPKKLNLKPQDINQLIRHALVLVRGDLGAHHITVVEELGENLPLVRFDTMKIEQVLVNLFTNAAYAMENGGTLTVRTSTRQVTGMGENISPNNGFRVGARLVTVEVCDTGSGIPAAMLGKVFEPFFTTKPTGQGTGLGLTVTKTIIDLHGGAIEIRNRPEGGACASVVFNAETD